MDSDFKLTRQGLNEFVPPAHKGMSIHKSMNIYYFFFF